MTVSATPPMLRTADARLGQTIRNEVYTALPLVMNTGGPRDPTAFMFLMPGVQSVGRWGNVMGGQDFTNETYVEGVPITNAVVQGEGRNLSFGISVEAIDQFQVETSGTAVMYNGQGASNYVVKSGTNQFRGSAFEFFRNKALDSKAFFAATKPDDNQHEYGFTLGGPLRRNQAFFFVAYDGYRDRRQTESRLISIPTRGAAQRRLQRAAGASSTIRRRRGRTRTAPASSAIRSPATSSRPNRISPISRNFQSFLPDPTNGDLQNNYLGGLLPIGFNNDNVTAKVDLRAVVAAPGLGAVRARQAQPGDAVSRRRQRADGAAAALHRDAPGRGDPDHRAGEAHLRDRLAVGEPGQPRASRGCRCRSSTPRSTAAIRSRRACTGLPAGEADSAFPEVALRRPERADATGAAPTPARSPST